MDVSELGQLTPEAALDHWYFQAKFSMLYRTWSSQKLPHEKVVVADFGCGLGLFLTFLERSKLVVNSSLFGVDNAYESTQSAIGSTVPIHPSFPEDKKCDVVLMMDVLEHIDDDHAALEFATSHLVPGGYGYISVPAFQWLWSSHDVFLHHKRRYTRSTLSQLVDSVADLELVRCHYYYASILPIAVLVRALKGTSDHPQSSDLKPVSKLVSCILKTALALESWIAPFNFFGGLSVVALVRKK